jgi:type IV pilus assembly protein PilV
MLEVLITIAIIAMGLLGLAGLQMRLHSSEMESYQRAQALVLLNDMSSRLASNRHDAANYVTGSALGAGMTCPTATTTRAERDLREWCLALQGAGEAIGTAKVGAMIGGRGCVHSLGGSQYMVTVAWQGQTPISAPPASVTCGVNAYNGASGTPCQSDLCRRAVTTVVRFASLT